MAEKVSFECSWRNILWIESSWYNVSINGVSGWNKRKLKGFLSPGAKQTVRNNEVSLKLGSDCTCLCQITDVGEKSCKQSILVCKTLWSLVAAHALIFIWRVCF